MKQLTEEQILKTVLEARTIEEAANSLGQGNVTTGSKVAVIDDDSTFPYSGLLGKVKSMKENGYAEIEFADGHTVPVQVNQLIVV